MIVYVSANWLAEDLCVLAGIASMFEWYVRHLELRPPSGPPPTDSEEILVEQQVAAGKTLLAQIHAEQTFFIEGCIRLAAPLPEAQLVPALSLTPATVGRPAELMSFLDARQTSSYLAILLEIVTEFEEACRTFLTIAMRSEETKAVFRDNVAFLDKLREKLQILAA